MTLPRSDSIRVLRHTCGVADARRMASRAIASLALAGLLVVFAGCAWLRGGDGAPDLEPGAREARIQALHAAIDEDHATLETLISEPRGEDELLRESRIRDIAERLGAHENELAALEAAAREERR